MAVSLVVEPELIREAEAYETTKGDVCESAVSFATFDVENGGGENVLTSSSLPSDFLLLTAAHLGFFGLPPLSCRAVRPRSETSVSRCSRPLLTARVVNMPNWSRFSESSWIKRNLIR